MHYIESEVTKTSYLYRLSGSVRIQVMSMESGLCLSPPMDTLVVSLVHNIICFNVKLKDMILMFYAYCAICWF